MPQFVYSWMAAFFPNFINYQWHCKVVNCLSFSFKYFLLIMLLQFSQFFPFILPPPCTPNPPAFPPPLVHVHGCTYKFFQSSVSHTIFDLSLSILCLPIMLLFPGPSPPHSPLHLPTENPPCDHHFSHSVPVLVVYLAFVFVF